MKTFTQNDINTIGQLLNAYQNGDDVAIEAALDIMEECGEFATPGTRDMERVTIRVSLRE